MSIFDRYRIVLARKNGLQAFTLLELIIAIGIAALIMAILLPSLAIFTKSLAALSIENNAYFAVSSALEELRKDISCAAVMFGITGAYFSFASYEDYMQMDFFSSQEMEASKKINHYNLKHISYVWSKTPTNWLSEKIEHETIYRISTSFRSGSTNVLETIDAWHGFEKVEAKVYFQTVGWHHAYLWCFILKIIKCLR